ncbi:hypothetical protein AMES_6177 [Amycolatopsis mediterranei S699]|uniref:DUF58 domain-containing protein n=3 Tax=Amycolatopsis mediterranei TaxID=33910 RepID=A0A0H3DCQ2_AMYMU|nr:DUF58 domain-containing protein [Amycolatopsis mediterranei]ADJ48002.1 conserved hypothetical protein [Amycolatopsis mediterranei U32]AEK44903.1 hypothetical protein RAM_32150 [Amycolatopsis mediterranei S699]AFO79713.1 hypothetical protein AMES_6177 [Amycolatopsis mediterranei S699]AGT86841.1 hypothetical protein B737_6177 [Amycolatopsis mediterranei RB]KDO10488.1 hypothetical protein DV26_11405 [Amycolatopsis mediterranei]
MLRALSGLTTRGRCLLAAGIAAAVCSFVLNERDLLRVAVFVVALPLLVAAFISATRLRIGAARTLRPQRVAVGGNGEVQLELWRSGRLPAGEILLEDGVPYALGSRPRFVVERLPHDRRVALRYPLQPVLRGVQQVGPLRATITDPFGLCEFERELIGHSRLVVVPRVVPLWGLPSGAGIGVGDDGTVRLHAGQGEADVIVRQYRHGDDLRKVHWRSTARRDEIMVRVEERPWRGGTTVLLDHRAAAHHGAGPAASLEWAVAFAASAALHLRRSGHRVRLVSEHGVTLADTPGDGGDHYDHVVLDALAALQPAHQRDITLAGDPAGGQELIAVLGTVSTEAVHELTQYRPRGIRSLAVLLDTPTWSAGVSAPEQRAAATEDSAALLRAAGWGVIVAGPGSPMPQVWAELCRSGARRGTLIGGPR